MPTCRIPALLWADSWLVSPCQGRSKNTHLENIQKMQRSLSLLKNHSRKHATGLEEHLNSTPLEGQSDCSPPKARSSLWDPTDRLGSVGPGFLQLQGPRSGSLQRGAQHSWSEWLQTPQLSSPTATHALPANALPGPAAAPAALPSSLS